LFGLCLMLAGLIIRPLSHTCRTHYLASDSRFQASVFGLVSHLSPQLQALLSGLFFTLASFIVPSLSRTYGPHYHASSVSPLWASLSIRTCLDLRLRIASFIIRPLSHTREHHYSASVSHLHASVSGLCLTPKDLIIRTLSHSCVPHYPASGPPLEA
jgi:hypothetical protein